MTPPSSSCASFQALHVHFLFDLTLFLPSVPHPASHRDSSLLLEAGTNVKVSTSPPRQHFCVEKPPTPRKLEVGPSSGQP